MQKLASHRKLRTLNKPRKKFSKLSVLATAIIISCSSGALAESVHVNKAPSGFKVEEPQKKQQEVNYAPLIPISLGLLLFAAVTLRMHLKHRNVGPWGTDRKKFEEHLAANRRHED